MPDDSPASVASGPTRPNHKPGTPTQELTRGVEEVGEVSVRTAGVFAAFFTYFGELVVMLWQAILSFGGMSFGDVVRQMSVVGIDTIPLAILTVGFSGAVLSLYTTNTLAGFGIPSLVGGIVALSIFRETGPILVGVVMAARAGSAMTAEIGSMKVTEQIDALRSMAISPIEYLVAPRMVAALTMMPVVCMFADTAGTFGGEIVAITKGVSHSAYLASIHQLLDIKDLFGGLMKCVVFGIIIALIGCREGMQSSGGAAGVGRATTRSVVISIILIFFANFFLSFLMYNTSFL